MFCTIVSAVAFWINSPVVVVLLITEAAVPVAKRRHWVFDTGRYPPARCTPAGSSKFPV
jgi:hypothetical protein